MGFIRNNWGLLLGAVLILTVVVLGSYQLSQRRSVGTVDTSQDTLAFRTSRDGNYDIYAWTVTDRKASRITTNPLEDGNPAYAPNGALLAYESWFNDQPEIYVADAINGVGGAITNNEAFDTDPDWNPDGQRIAFISDRDGTNSVYIIDRETDATIRVTGDEGMDASPTWSPNGQEIIFASNRGGTFGLYRLDVNSCHPPGDGNAATPQTCDIETVVADGADYLQPDWAPNGRDIVFASTREGDQALYIFNLRNGNLQRITEGPLDGHPAYSVDGGRVAYTGNTGDNNEVFIHNLNDGATEQLTNNPADDGQPAWRPIFIEDEG